MKLSTTNHTLILDPPPTPSKPSDEDLKPVVRFLQAGILSILIGVPAFIPLVHIKLAYMDNGFGEFLLIGVAIALAFSWGMLMLKGTELEARIRQEFKKANSDKTEEWKANTLVPYLSEKYGVEVIELCNGTKCIVRKNGQNFTAILTGVSITQERGTRGIYSSASVDYSKLGMFRMFDLAEEE